MGKWHGHGQLNNNARLEVSGILDKTSHSLFSLLIMQIMYFT